MTVKKLHPKYHFEAKSEISNLDQFSAQGIIKKLQIINERK